MKTLIYIEEYEIYQEFDGRQSIFLNGNPCKEENAKVAVISKNINFSVITPENGRQVKKSRFNKYLNGYYKNESYFAAGGNGTKFGIYHALTKNIKKYYSLCAVDFVIPYDYLVILFLNKKMKVEDGTSLLFIEAAADRQSEAGSIYKAMAISNGFNIFPVISFKEDMFNENLNFLQTKLNSKGIKIGKIFTNKGNEKLSILFPEAEVVKFDTKEFFDFFGSIENSTPHFENPDVKFKKLDARKNRLRNMYIAALILFIAVMQLWIIFLNNNIRNEKKRINFLNNNIANLSQKIGKDKEKLAFNKHFSSFHIVNYLKWLISVFPKDAKIKNIILTKSKNHYMLYGHGFIEGGYKKFVGDYNLLMLNGNEPQPHLNHAPAVKILHISYDLDKFDKPSFNFYESLK
ncbi:MAG: hypothetical protein M0016_01855 [Deltaproteobacteria bacterium]|jgi:hypothetical protein|nr:hypothetical protein [Deltaproteobacteria bacterium]MCL5879825.1 hypothetical protein [Deltaproteobacteria bacterium]MDA8303892.1 hypothetical protein [Deltaproteobacteria bacterium]